MRSGNYTPIVFCWSILASAATGFVARGVKAAGLSVSNNGIALGKKGRAGRPTFRDADGVKAKHIFLALSVIAISIGVSAGKNIYMDVGLPIGVILFGLFLVATVTEKEVALYDAQQAAERPNSAAHKKSTREVAANNPVLTAAHSH
jgi:hypothetical protein